jgi:hypothetical protein
MRTALAMALFAAALSAGCKRERPSPPLVQELFRGSDASAGGPAEFVDESFDQLYPVFLLRKVEPGPKATLWNRYYRRWVRWSGTLVSFTANGCTVKEIPNTLTFDVSVIVDAANRERLHHYKPGDAITYIGQLEGYDDIFRTFYLVHGDVGPPP